MGTIKRSSLANGLVNRLNEQRHPGRVVASFARFSVHAPTMRQSTKLPDASSGVFSLNGVSVMAKRKAISTRTRFEIFKRDSFQCQYCGRTPPTVVLNIDHVHPVAEGGDNEPENLITACEECNSGKSDKLLSQVTPTLQAQMAEQRKRKKQLDQYNDWLMETRNSRVADIEEIGLYWFNQYKSEKNRFVFGTARVPSIKNFIARLPKAKILDAIDIAMSRLPVSTDGDDYSTFKYFCGVCWGMIKGPQDA